MHPHVTVLGRTPNLGCMVQNSLRAVSTLPALPHASTAAVQAPTSWLRRADLCCCCLWGRRSLSRPRSR